MKEVFKNPLEGELPKKKGEFDHEINLTVNSLPKTPGIPLRPDNQAFVKNYLDTMLRKAYIQISKLSMGAPLFLVPKKDGKQPVVDYQKLNNVTEKDLSCPCAYGRGRCNDNKDNHVVGGLIVYQGVV